MVLLLRLMLEDKHFVACLKTGTDTQSILPYRGVVLFCVIIMHWTSNSIAY